MSDTIVCPICSATHEVDCTWDRQTLDCPCGTVVVYQLSEEWDGENEYVSPEARVLDEGEPREGRYP